VNCVILNYRSTAAQPVRAVLRSLCDSLHIMPLRLYQQLAPCAPHAPPMSFLSRVPERHVPRPFHTPERVVGTNRALHSHALSSCPVLAGIVDPHCRDVRTRHQRGLRERIKGGEAALHAFGGEGHHARLKRGGNLVVRNVGMSRKRHGHHRCNGPSCGCAQGHNARHPQVELVATGKILEHSRS